MKKKFQKLILTLIICFSCCISAVADTPAKMPVKRKEIFPNLPSYFQKIKTAGKSYKTQLETKYFEERLKKTPNDVELLKTYADFLKDHRYFSESINIYKRLIKLTKNDSFKKNIDEINVLKSKNKQASLFLIYLKQAQNYESQGNIAKANEYYLKAQNIFPERYEVKFGLAKTYCWLNQPKLAINYYEGLLKKSPKNIDLLDAYADCLKTTKDYTHAKEIYNKLLKQTKNKKYNDKLQDIYLLEKGLAPKKSNAELAETAKLDKVYFGYIKQAKEYESQSKISKANEYYLKALKENPNRFEAKFGLAKTYDWLGNKKLALAYYTELLKTSSNNPDLLAAYNKFLKESKGSKKYQAKPQKTPPGKPQQKYQAQNLNAEKDKAFSDYIKKAQSYETQGKAAEANEYYLKAGKIYPSRYEVEFGLAKTYGWLHQDTLALEYYKKLLAQSPDNVDLLEAYANYLKDNKNYSEAMEIYNKLLAKSKDLKYQIKIAEIFFLQKDYATSLKMYYSIYNKNPNNPDVQKGIALSYFVSGDFDKAICFYQKYFEQSYDQESILNYAKSLFYTKHIQPAKEIMEKFVCVYPCDIEGLNTLADIYLATKETPKAIEIINRAISIKPDNVKSQIQIAKIDISAKNYCEAQCILLQLLAIEPENIEILESLGDISFYTEDFNQALIYFQCIPDYKNNPRLNYKIAQSYHYGKNYRVAQHLYEQLVYNQEFGDKARIGLAEIQISKDKPLKARDILEGVLENDPQNIQAKKNLAISYYSTGDNFKSIKILETLPKDDSDINYNLAKAYNGIERKDTALELLDGNPQKNAKELKGKILMQVRPALEPIYDFYYMTPPDGNANAGMYQKAGGNGYLYLRPNLRAVGTITTTNYRNITNIVSTQGTLVSAGLEGKPTDHIGFKSAIGIDVFSNNGNRILGNALVKLTPNDVVTLTSGYIRSLDEIDSYMSAAGVVPTTGPFANQLVGRIVDNKYILANLGLKLPYKFYAYGSLNFGNKYGANSPANSYREVPAGFGKVVYSAAEEKHINQALIGYDFYYTGYTNDRSGFGGANLNYSPIGSDGLATDPSSGFPGVGGYFSPTFFIANKLPITIKGSFKQKKLKYVASAFIGTQSIRGQIGLLGPGGGGDNLRTTMYYGYSLGLRYNEDGRYSWGADYIFNNYMTVAQHLLRIFLLIRF